MSRAVDRQRVQTYSRPVVFLDKGDDRPVPEIAYVNGEFLPLERATIRVEDRGFQFADGVYEVLRTYGGRPFATPFASRSSTGSPT